MLSCAEFIDSMKKAKLKSSRSLSITYKYLNILNCCTLSAAFMSALFASSSATVSVCPLQEATNTGVEPSSEDLSEVMR
jgi:hypothetical protein